MIYSKKENKGIFLFSVILFFLIFNPPILGGFSFTVFSVLLSVFYCVVNRKETISVINNSKIRRISSVFLVFVFYNLIFSVLNYLRNGNDVIWDNLKDFFVGYLSLLFVSFAILSFMIKSKRSLTYLLYSYLYAGIYQTLLAIVCLLFPPVKSFFNSMMVNNSGSEKISHMMETAEIYSLNFRNYGFASTLFDIFGMTMSVLTIIAIMLGFNGQKKYFLVAVLMAVAAIINARTSFFLISAGFFVLLFSSKDKKTSRWIVKRVLIVVSIITTVIFIFIWILDNQTSQQLVWLASAVTETMSTSSGSTYGYYDILINEFLFFPSDFFSILFGTSLSSLQAIDKGSDVGYVQYIWCYGIVGSILQYIVYYNLLSYPIKYASWPESRLFKAFLVMISIYLVKLTCLGYSMTSVIIVPLCIYAIYSITPVGRQKITLMKN